MDYILKDDTSSLDYLVSTLKRLIANTQTKILIVDDASFFRKVISELLYIHRYKIIAATSGEEAIRALDMHQDIKLVITDFIMPGMDGCELCKKIRTTHKKEDLARVLKAFGSGSDVIARLGGEEFCILSLMDQADKQISSPGSWAMEKFDALRRQIAAMEIDIKTSSSLKITMSIGVGFNKTMEFDEMLKQADERLYHAKSSGRNQVILSLD